jgi:hypothetical protein
LLCLWRLHRIPDAGVAPSSEIALVVITPRDRGSRGGQLISMHHISRSHGLIVVKLELLLLVGVHLVESLLLVGVHDC